VVLSSWVGFCPFSANIRQRINVIKLFTPIT
jgi:hypothetical protein